MANRVFMSSPRAAALAARARVLLLAVGSVRQLTELLNGYTRTKRIHANRLHTLLSGAATRALNPTNFAAIERAVRSAEGSRPDLVEAGLAARRAAEETVVAEITVRSEFVLKLTQEEVRLVGLGLAGKLKGKDAADALTLNVRLMEQRMRYLTDLADVTAGALEAARQEAAEAAAGRRSAPPGSAGGEPPPGSGRCGRPSSPRPGRPTPGYTPTRGPPRRGAGGGSSPSAAGSRPPTRRTRGSRPFSSASGRDFPADGSRPTPPIVRGVPWSFTHSPLPNLFHRPGRWTYGTRRPETGRTRAGGWT